jgi:hypothetical protein
MSLVKVHEARNQPLWLEYAHSERAEALKSINFCVW